MKRAYLLAILALSGCLAAPPAHPRALEANELCTQYISNGDLTRAEVQCDLGLQFSPQYADLWVNKGLIALRRGNDDLAKEHFIKALRYNQEQAQAYNNLGYVYYKNRQYGKAHDNFQRALKVNPDYIEARYNLSLVHKEMGNLDKSKKELRTIIAINGNIADAHATLGSVLHEEKALDEAVQELSIATQLDPQFGSAWLELGNTLMDSGKFAEACDAFTSCIEVDPNGVECKNNVTICKRKAGLQDTALKEIKENATGKNTAESMYTLARGYKEKGLRNEEERTYKKCLKLDPKFALCHFGLFEIFKEDARDKDARVACQNFIKFADATDYKSQVSVCESFVSANTY
jgi:tetratricopeptide (TPR) repeat protein